MRAGMVEVLFSFLGGIPPADGNFRQRPGASLLRDKRVLLFTRTLDGALQHLFLLFGLVGIGFRRCAWTL